MKALTDRLAYALIGAVLGVAVGLGLWFFYDAGFSRRVNAPEIHLGLKSWVLYGAAVFAALGFVLKDGVGGATGNTMRAVHRHESRSDFSLPGWLWLLLGLLGAALAWHWLG